MPKLDSTHLVDRIKRRLGELSAGATVGARDLRAVLTDQQNAQLEKNWTEQKALKAKHRPKSAEQRAALGWKTKRDLYIEALESALGLAQSEQLEAFESKLRRAEVRRAKIFLEAFSSAADKGKEPHACIAAANNDLARAGLQGVNVNRSDLIHTPPKQMQSTHTRTDDNPRSSPDEHE
jgi:hypothetical protein